MHFSITTLLIASMASTALAVPTLNDNLALSARDTITDTLAAAKAAVNSAKGSGAAGAGTGASVSSASAPKLARGDAFSDFANGVGGSTEAASPKEGQPCTGSVNNSQRSGFCTATGRCGINVPPNEFDQVASADCQ